MTQQVGIGAQLAAVEQQREAPTPRGVRLGAMLDAIEGVCALPKAIGRVVALCDGEAFDLAGVVAALGAQPGLCEQVLSFAMRPAYARSELASSLRSGDTETERLQNAVLTLGIRDLHHLVVVLAITARSKTGHRLQARLSRHCQLSGDLALALSEEMGSVPRGLALLCGRASELGALAVVAVDGLRYENLWRVSRGEPRRRAALERRIYGATSQHVAVHLLRKYGIDEEVLHALGAELDSDFARQSELGRVAAFSRVTAPWLLRADGNPFVQRQLSAWARHCGLGEINPQRLVDRFKDARFPELLRVCADW